RGPGAGRGRPLVVGVGRPRHPADLRGCRPRRRGRRGLVDGRQVAADGDGDGDGDPDAPGAGGGAGLPFTDVQRSVVFITWTKVWPTVNGIGRPWLSKNWVGDVWDGFFQVPLIVTPFVETQAGPDPIWSASSRCLNVSLSFSGPKCMTITITFF